MTSSAPTILHGDCLNVLKSLPKESIDSLVTDPPAGISFMGKDWDSDKGGREGWIAWMSEVMSEGWIAWMSEVMSECMRVLKPGAHALVWAIPRTSHWTATAVENAGFEIRDVVTHLFGQGFPKSLDISKAIDKAAGAERPILEWRKSAGGRTTAANPMDRDVGKTNTHDPITAPATESAKQWQGWGTALKPAAEFWILARKPISEKTVAANVLKHGTGGINIDGCRIETREDTSRNISTALGRMNDDGWKPKAMTAGGHAQGRFPANLVLSHSPHCTKEQCDVECAVLALDAQSGERKSAGKYRDLQNAKEGGNGMFAGGRCSNAYAGDSGGASRFFYVAKVSPSERGKDNKHPTVKPIKLMAYLIRLITPPGGVVLDPFAGSGTTGVAAIKEGFRFVGIEREKEYFEIAKARMEVATA